MSVTWDTDGTMDVWNAGTLLPDQTTFGGGAESLKLKFKWG
jgi:hypothetical protein